MEFNFKQLLALPVILSWSLSSTVFATQSGIEGWRSWPSGDLDFSKKIVNQAKANTIVLDDQSKGFRVVREMDLSLESSLPFNLSPFQQIPVGVWLEGKKKVLSSRFVKDYETAKRIRPVWVGGRAEGLESWSREDWAMYTVEGTIGFYVGPGFGSFGSAGVGVGAGGRWVIYVEKTGDHKAYVKVTRSKLSSLAVSVDAVLMNVDVSQFKEADREFSFGFDLTEKEGRRAFEDAVRGSLFLAQKLSAKGDSVWKDAESRNSLRGRALSWYFGVPFLFNHYGTKGEVYGHSLSTQFEDGSSSVDYFAVLMNEKGVGGLISDKEFEENNFSGTYSISKDRDGSKSVEYEGEHVWSYADSRTGQRELSHAISAIVRRTGLRGLSQFNIQERNLGYFKATLNTKLSTQATKAIIRLASDANGQRKLAAAVQEALERYFAEGDRDRLCGIFGIEEADDTHAVNGACAASLQRKTALAVQQMIASAQAMRASLAKDDRAGFVRAYAYFGKGFLANQFTYQGVLKAVEGAPVSVTFGIEGERVSQMKAKLNAQALIEEKTPVQALVW